MSGIDLAALGWEPETLGELDHRRLKAPSVKLRATRRGAAGDIVFAIDLRLRRPNANAFLSSAECHSFEHFLLEGFSTLLPRNFLGVGVMGCRTGFYLQLLNEGRRVTIEAVFESILRAMEQATTVPYARIDQCGHWQDHDLDAARALAAEVLARREAWSCIA